MSPPWEPLLRCWQEAGLPLLLTWRLLRESGFGYLWWGVSALLLVADPVGLQRAGQCDPLPLPLR